MRSILHGALCSIVATIATLALASCEGTLAPRLDVVLSQPAVHLSAIRGSGSSVSQTITVSNGGAGRLEPVTCPTAPAAWLSCSVADGNLVTFTASPVGLTSSPPAVSVPLSTPGGAQHAAVSVDLSITQPVLGVSAAAVGFSGVEGSANTTPGTATVTVTNTGAGTFGNLGAISCTPTPATSRVSCAVNAGTGVLTISVDPLGLTAATYLYTLTVTSENNTTAQVVTVSLSLGARPVIVLSQGAVLFTAIRGAVQPMTRTITVSNGGGQSLGAIGCPAAPAAWLACAVSGSTITLAANPAGLTASPATVQVPVSASAAVNSPQNVSVSLAIEQPIVALSASSVSFAGQEGVAVTTPASATVNVTNAGAGTLVALGTITCTATAPVTCGVASSTGVLSISVNPVAVTAGTHLYQVTVSAANSGVSRTLSVVLTLTGLPRIVLSPSEVNFHAIRGHTMAVRDTLTVLNGGGGSLGMLGCPLHAAAWLTCVALDSVTFELTADPTGLITSPLDVLVPITSTTAVNSPQNLAVSFEIQQPVLSLAGTLASFTATAPATTATPATVVITASNAGIGTLADLGAITCVPGNARVTCLVNGATGELTLSVDPTGLAAGVTTYTVTVSAANAGNGSQVITVILTVT
jgi:hypothetical protein